MKIAARLVGVALFAVVAIWLWGVFFPNPDKVIRKRFAEIARAASFAPGQSYLSRLAGAQRLSDFFATNVEIDIDIPGHQRRQLTGREELLQAALSARATLDGLKVTFPDISLNIEPDKEAATADLTAEAQLAGDADLDVQELKFELRKTGNQWLVTRVQTLQILQHAGPQ
jgi:hypothetical protein